MWAGGAGPTAFATLKEAFPDPSQVPASEASSTLCFTGPLFESLRKLDVLEYRDEPRDYHYRWNPNYHGSWE